MEEKTKIINFNKIEDGMIVARTIEQNGKVLIKKDITLTYKIIKKLRQLYFIEKIEVYDKKAEKKIVNIKSKQDEDLDKLEDKFKDMSINLQRTFRQIANYNKRSMNEIMEFSQKIQDELKPSNLVIKDIVLYGSGEDTIYRHGVNVAALSSYLGKWVGFEEEKINLLVYSAIFHDIGKTKIRRDILDKASTLTTSEFNTIKTHAQEGYKIIKEISFLDKSVSHGVLMHHERLDGSGYPLGLKGDTIHPFAKIIAIADVFDAINSNRVYKNKRLPFEALQIVKNESLGKLDYEYVSIFLEHIVNYYIGEEVLLNTNQKCKIIKMNLNNLDKPLVLKDGEFIELEKEKNIYIKEMLL